MNAPQTTIEKLCDLYDKALKHIEEKLDDGTATASDIGELRKMLDSAQVLQLVRAAAAPKPGSALPELPYPVPVAVGE